MSANTSSSNSSFSDLYPLCVQASASKINYNLYAFTVILFLFPLYILILHMGFRQWRQQTMSHSDFLTCHTVIVDIVSAGGSLLRGLSIFTDSATVFMLGTLMFSVVFPGQTLFQCLACVDRYLAVVHPITYTRLRGTGGVRIRNVSIASVWLLCFGWVWVTKLYFPGFPGIPLLFMLGISILVVLFCSLAVLCVLTRPGPGEVGGDKDRVDQSKKRAFHIIMAIMGALLLRVVVLLISVGLYELESIDPDVFCVLVYCSVWLTVPSSLILPLLFLHKTGKLTCCRRKTQTNE